MRIHVLALGQSNLANHCGTARKSKNGRAILDGSSHPLDDPIPGGTGELGSVWPRFADTLRARVADVNFSLTLAAKGGTSIEEWVPGGPCFKALETRIEAGDADTVNLVIFQQGEKDTLLETTEAEYSARFQAMYRSVLAKLGMLPWIICKSSHRLGVTSQPVTSAQEYLARTLPYAHTGPDLDKLGSIYRVDDTHFNDAGLSILAEQLVECVLDPNLVIGN